MFLRICEIWLRLALGRKHLEEVRELLDDSSNERELDDEEEVGVPPGLVDLVRRKREIDVDVSLHRPRRLDYEVVRGLLRRWRCVVDALNDNQFEEAGHLLILRRVANHLYFE